MAVLAVQDVTAAGLAPAYAAAAGGGDEFANDGNVVLHVKNGGGAPINVTVNSVTPCNYGSDHDLVVAVPNAGERIIGPFPTSRFNDANGRVGVTYSGVVTVTVAALRT